MRRILPFLLVSIVVVVAFVSHKTPTPAIGHGECNLNVSASCALAEDVLLEVSPWPIEVEQLHTLTITAQAQPEAKVEGMNMFMGYIPLVFEPKGASVWQADLILGACAEPDMQWLMSLSQGSNSYSIDFSTHL